LKVHAAQSSFLKIGCKVGLGNDGLQPMGLEFILTKGASKKAARVFPALQIDNKGTLQLGLGKNHNPTPDPRPLPVTRKRWRNAKSIATLQPGKRGLERRLNPTCGTAPQDLDVV
jgi:hypothetical protein